MSIRYLFILPLTFDIQTEKKIHMLQPGIEPKIKLEGEGEFTNKMSNLSTLRRVSNLAEGFIIRLVKKQLLHIDQISFK